MIASETYSSFVFENESQENMNHTSLENQRIINQILFCDIKLMSKREILKLLYIPIIVMLPGIIHLFLIPIILVLIIVIFYFLAKIYFMELFKKIYIY